MAVSQSLTLTQVSQDIAGNFSKVRILWQSTQTGESHNDEARTAYFYISRNGEAEKEYTVTYTLPRNTTRTILDVTITLGHYSDGTGSVRVRTWMDTRISAGEVRLSKTLALTQIPRESTVGATDAYIGSNTAITIARKNSLYTHSLHLRFGTEAFYLRQDGSTSQAEAVFSGESVSFPIPLRFYSQIPQSRSGVCTLTVKTYSGTTVIGSPKTCTFSVMTNGAACTPTVTGTVTDGNSDTVALTGDPAKLIRYASTAVCRITAEAKYGAEITERKIGGVCVTEERSFPKVQSDSFTFSATDGRGYSGSLTVSPDMVPYIPLTCTATAGRTDPTSGNAILQIAGNYFTGDFGAAENTLSVSYRVGDGNKIYVTPEVSDGRYSVRIPLENLDYTREHTISVFVLDKIRGINLPVTVGKGVPVFDWGEEDFQFHVPVGIPRFLVGTGSQGDCANADTDMAPGTYRLTENSANCPIKSGILVVFSTDSGNGLQLAVNPSGNTRRLRVILDGTAGSWVTI